MTVALWNSRFETGIHAVDAQHKALFEAVNRLAAALGSESMGEGVKESLDFLARSTLITFRWKSTSCAKWPTRIWRLTRPNTPV